MIKKFFKWMTTILLVLVLLLTIASIFMKVRPFEKMPWIKGYKPLIVLGGSMEPEIHLGGVVLVSSVEAADIKVGDIITFKAPVRPGETLRGERVLTTHRVVEVSDEEGRLSFKTKGDANESLDISTVSERDVLGRASFSVPYLGYVANFVRKPVGFALLVILPGLLIIATEVRNILVQIRLVKGTTDA